MGPSLKILYLSHRIPYPPNKGDKIRSFHEIEYLSREHSLHVAALVDNPDDFQYEKDLQRYCRKLALFPLHPWYGKLRGLATLAKGKPLSVGYFYSNRMQQTINHWLETDRYEAVICFSSPMAEYISASPQGRIWSAARNGTRRPALVMDFCDVDSDKWAQYARETRFPMNRVYGLEYKRLLAYEKKVNRAFDHSLFVSRSEVDLFRRLYPDAANLGVIPNGVDVDYFSPNHADRFAEDIDRIRRQGPVLVFTGAMDYQANVDGVVWFCRSIFPSIRIKFPTCRFYIVGSRPAAEVKALEQTAGIIVTGFVPDIRPYYLAADVSVVPLRLARGVQNKVLEAMAMGNAVVATPAAVKGIASDWSGCLMVSDQPENFAEEVMRCLDNPATAEALGAGARTFVGKHYHWDAHMMHLERLFSNSTGFGLRES